MKRHGDLIALGLLFVLVIAEACIWVYAPRHCHIPAASHLEVH